MQWPARSLARARGVWCPVPVLLARLGAPARVTVVSAPPGSGKTVLLRSWIAEAAPSGRVASVAVGRDERDPQRFWLSVLGALRRSGSGVGAGAPVDCGARHGRVGDRRAADERPGAAGGPGLG